MTIDARAWIDRWPVTRGFGDMSMPQFGPHSGIDLGIPEGTPIPALRDGVVDLDDDDSSYDPLRWQTWSGIAVRYRLPDGASMLSAHMSSNIVSAGDTLHAGDVIGYCGHTGAATGPHLHLEVRDASGQLVDPLIYFAKEDTVDRDTYARDIEPLVKATIKVMVEQDPETRQAIAALGSGPSTDHVIKAIGVKLAS